MPSIGTCVFLEDTKKNLIAVLFAIKNKAEIQNFMSLEQHGKKLSRKPSYPEDHLNPFSANDGARHHFTCNFVTKIPS